MNQSQRILATLALICVVVAAIVMAAPAAQPSLPTKLFDVRNGNGIIDNGTTYQFAYVIVFPNKAAKDKFDASFGEQYNYQSTVPDPADPSKTIPNPQNLSRFTMARLTAYGREIVVASDVTTAVEAARKTAKDAVDATVPPN